MTLGKIEIRETNAINSLVGRLMNKGGEQPPEKYKAGHYWIKHIEKREWVVAQLYKPAGEWSEGFWSLIGDTAQYSWRYIKEVGPQILPPKE
jgi:hypothetical protein